jgi:Holliday junction resolvase RusA-like endonuclease
VTPRTPAADHHASAAAGQLPPAPGPHPARGEGAVAITVYGTPAGQGQITFLGPGRGAKHTNEKALKPWRAEIIAAAQRATGCHGYVEWGALKRCAICRLPSQQHGLFVDVPVGVDLTVTVGKPKSAPKRTRSWPITRFSTDADHHARACLDALSAAGVYRDDSQVVELAVRKVYPLEHELALDRPGARIRVWCVSADIAISGQSPL